MKNSCIRLLFFVFAGCFCLLSCEKKGPDGPEQGEVNPPNVFPAVVNIDYDKATVALCDPAAGKYAIQFKDKVSTIKEGSVVIVEDGDEYRIVLVTQATTKGNRVDFSGKLGDLRYVFRNTKFTLRIGDEGESGGSGDVYYPTKTGDQTASKSKTITLWDEPLSKDYTLWELKKEDYPEWMIQIPTTIEEHADLSAHVEFDPMLVADLEFEFGAERQDFLDGIAFAMAGAYDVRATISGDFHSSLDFNFNYKMDDVWDGIVHGGERPRYYFDKTELLKHDLFSKDFFFTVGGIPFVIHAGCDLFAEMMSTMHGEANLTFGVESDMHFMASVKVSPYRDQIVDHNQEFDFDWDGHEPVFSGKEDVELKWYLYPHFYFWIDYGVGPCLDIKPYASVDFGHGGRKNLAELESFDDFYTWTTNGFVGLDWSVGLSTPLENYFYEVDAVTKDLGNIAEWEFLKSPSGLIMESEPDQIKAGESTTLNFVVLGDFYGKPATTWFPTFIKLDFPETGAVDYLIPLFGKASYTWTPQFEDDVLVARVFDLDGNVMGQRQFRAGPGDYLKVTTGEATDITSSSATITSIIESNMAITNAGIVYSSSVDVPAMGEPGCLIQYAQTSGDSFTVQLANLQAGTQYHYRAFATTQDGESGERIVYGTKNSLTTTSEGKPSISITPGEYDFKEVPIGSSAEHDFIVTNSGSADLVFTAELPEGPFTVRPNGEMTLAPGGEKVLTVTFAPAEAGSVRAVLTLRTNVPGDPLLIPVSGLGTTAASADPGPYSVPAVPEAVDLGLSVKWASFNLGATKPEEYGDYFAWGEVEPFYISQNPLVWREGKSAGYSMDSTRWGWYSADENVFKVTKYCWADDFCWAGTGDPDNKGVLDPEDDAASVQLGGKWRTPTQAEYEELRKECKWKWTNVNGVNGRMVTGPNGNSIFLPAAGAWVYTNLDQAGSLANYWTASLFPDASDAALFVQFSSGAISLGSGYSRFMGFSVRPVTE